MHSLPCMEYLNRAIHLIPRQSVLLAAGNYLCQPHCSIRIHSKCLEFVVDHKNDSCFTCLAQKVLLKFKLLFHLVEIHIDNLLFLDVAE